MEFWQKFWLHKSTGGVCLSIASKGLAITGIDDRRYWSHIPTEESGWDSCTLSFQKIMWWFWRKWETLYVSVPYLLDGFPEKEKRKNSLRWMMGTPVVQGISLLESVKVGFFSSIMLESTRNLLHWVNLFVFCHILGGTFPPKNLLDDDG